MRKLPNAKETIATVFEGIVIRKGRDSVIIKPAIILITRLLCSALLL